MTDYYYLCIINILQQSTQKYTKYFNNKLYYVKPKHTY